MSLALAPSATPLAVDAGRCFHCGEPLPVRPVPRGLDGERREFCCHGCAAAAALIHEQGLADFYRLGGAASAPRPEAVPDFSAWDHAEWLEPWLERDADGGRRLSLVLEGLRCAACAWLVRRALGALPGVRAAEVNLLTGRLSLAWEPERIALSAILARLAGLGYRPALPGDPRAAVRDRAAQRASLKRLAVAGLGAFQAMMLSEALFLGADGSMPAATRDLFRWLAFLLTTPVVFYAGWPFLAGMAAELRQRAPGMDSLVASGTLAAWLGSVVETLRGGPHVWYDAAAMFVLFLLVARHLEAAQRRRARAAVEALGGREVALALREHEDGRLEALPPSALRPGDRVLVRAGEALPADGILEQDAELDEALLTGESRPVHRAAGSLALAGSIALGASLRLRVHRVGAQCLRAELARLAERAQLERPPLVERAEALALRFTAVVFLIALAAGAFWLAHEPARAFEVLLAVLVVSCPCALTLALPSALAAAHAALARRGVLSLRAGALARLAQVDWALLDKTGTLTRGRPRLAAVRTLAAVAPGEALELAAALARESAHPYAAVFPRDPGPRAEALRLLPGRGLEGRIGGRRYRLGHGDFVGGAGPLALAREIEATDRFEPLAVFELDDPPRADAEDALAALRAQGLGIELASGDAPDAVARLAARLGIRCWRASCTPEDKLALLRARRAEGRRVLAVGDGANDAPLLAAAELSMAFARGSALAHHAADLVIVGDRLRRVPEAIALARRARRVLRQNLAWAIGYNLLALPLAAAGMITPWIAALGMALSSLIVSLNSARLLGTGDAAASHR